MKSLHLLLVVLLLSGFQVTGAQNISIGQFDFAISIDNRQPVGVDTVFTQDVGNVFCYTNIKGIEDTAEIYHVWHYKDEEKARIKLPVESSDWRAWSSKSILKSWTGGWRVIVEDAEGNVLASKSFVIR